MADTPTADPIERLIASQQALTDAIGELAQSNRDLVDLIAADMDVEPDDHRPRLLDGTPGD